MNQTNIMMAIGVLVVVVSCYYMYKEVNNTKQELDVTRNALRSMQEDFVSTIQAMQKPALKSTAKPVPQTKEESTAETEEE